MVYLCEYWITVQTPPSQWDYDNHGSEGYASGYPYLITNPRIYLFIYIDIIMSVQVGWLLFDVYIRYDIVEILQTLSCKKPRDNAGTSADHE